MLHKEDTINSDSRDQLARALADPLFAEALFDQLPDVVFFVKNNAGLYVAVNRTLVYRCGYREKSDLIGKSPLDVFPPELGSVYAEQDRQVAELGRAISDRLELHLYPNRARGWCLTHKIPLRDAENRVIGVAGISRDLHPPDRGDPVHGRVAETIAYIQDHYAEPLRLEDLARIAGMSPVQLERHIGRIFSLTPKQLIIKTRLDAATAMLEGASNVVEIANACGYADQSAFSRQFKAAVGLSPTQYRTLARARAAEYKETRR